jgi:hypothetical protein
VKARRPGGFDKGEHELHLAIAELELGAFRNLVTALAGRYPTREAQGTGVVEDALRHFLAALRLIERRCSKLRSCARKVHAIADRRPL